ncbi:prepro-urotensin II-beta-like [Myxocyprinus asiaticus]|uniref:prepro-urotensin II-beta-like n=1 Tax=Myxocyprinus asiaticus TaxID=70543 RepID=UPI002222F7E4|nr:prepro-urotensin II-beta-like [Myxocyprinus asiaticus]
MLCKLILFFALLLVVLEPLLGHPVDTYARPVLVEEEQVVSPEDLSYSEQAYLGYPSLITGDIIHDGLRTAGFVPSQAVKEVFLEKPFLNPLRHFLGNRKQYRKRGSNTECFWKYCV